MEPHNTDFIALNTGDGFVIEKVSDIVCCIADGSYTSIVMAGGMSHNITKRLSMVAEMLPSSLFLRTHHHYLINRHHVRLFSKSNGNKFMLSNGMWAPLATRRQEGILKEFRVL